MSRSIMLHEPKTPRGKQALLLSTFISLYYNYFYLFNQRISEVSAKEQNNDKVHSDEDQICSVSEGALAILSPTRSSVIVSDKIRKSASQKPSDDLCPIYGATAGKHRYYGGKSCGPCRAFFRRSVQSKYFEIFHCKSGENCTIEHDSRKKCQFCR